MAKVICFDLEANGFIPQVDTIWMVSAKEIGNDKTYVFSDYTEEADGKLEDFKAYLNSADVLVGHNIYGYDLEVLQVLTGWTPNWNKQKIVDTMIMSWLVDFKYPGGHSLRNLGKRVGVMKEEYEGGFDAFNMDMFYYGKQDVVATEAVYTFLASECRKIMEKKPLFKLGLQHEMRWAYYEMQMRMKGWVFDMEGAEKALDLWETRMLKIENTINPHLGYLVKPGTTVEKLTKSAGKKTEVGEYTSNVAKYFDISPNRSLIDNPIAGPFCKIKTEKIEMGSMDLLKSFLETIGWIPDDFNVKRENGKWVQTTAKLTETSLSELDDKNGNTKYEGFGSLINEYFTLRSRASILTGWIEEVNKRGDGRLRGRTWTIGTPTFRCRHNVICNIPSIDSPGGKELRGSLICEEGYQIVGADSSGNQFRALAHYMKDKEFTESVIHGSSSDGTDVHSRNAKLIGCTRKLAKPFIYALLFGAGDEKLGLILTGQRKKEIGRKARLSLMKGLPGLKALTEKVTAIYYKFEHEKGRGCFPALDGRMVYPASSHQALNYLLQACEAITCKAALVYAFDKMTKENINYYPTIFYHDEIAAAVKKEDAERAKEIMIEAFKEAPKLFGVDIMDGDGAIGNSYADVH